MSLIITTEIPNIKVHRMNVITVPIMVVWSYLPLKKKLVLYLPSVKKLRHVVSFAEFVDI